MGIAPGWLVMTIVIAFYTTLVVIAFATRRLRHAVGEVFPRYGESKPASAKAAPSVDPQMNVSAEPAKSYPFLAIVTADQIDPIATSIQSQFNRSPSHLDPNNTTGTQASLLLPVTVTEIAALKALVKELDSQGVVVVIPANEIFEQSATIQKAVQPVQEG